MSRSDIPDWLRIDFENGYTPGSWSPTMEHRAYRVWVNTGGVVKNPPNVDVEPADWPTGVMLLVAAAAFVGGWFLALYWRHL